MEQTAANMHDDPARASRGQRLLAMAGVGLVTGLMALGVTNLASAQVDRADPAPVDSSAVVLAGDETDETSETNETDSEAMYDADEMHDAGDELSAKDLSAEDEAVFDRFDTCLDEALATAGITLDQLDQLEDADEDAITSFEEAHEDAIDDAFDSCDPILDELSDDAMAWIDEDCDDYEDHDEEHDEDDDDEEDDADDE